MGLEQPSASAGSFCWSGLWAMNFRHDSGRKSPSGTALNYPDEITWTSRML
jgi:hypothetical protein